MSIGISSIKNSTTVPLGGGETFTGEWETNNSDSVLMSSESDVAGTIFFDFSNDGGITKTTFPVAGFAAMAGIHEFHTALKGARSFRVRYVNGAAAQSYLRLYVYYGDYAKDPNSPISQGFASDADAILVRPTSDHNLDVVRDLVGGQSGVSKFGSIVLALADTVQDVWDGGGTYTFPASTADMTHVSQTTDQVAARGSTWTLQGLSTAYGEVEQNVLLDATDTTTPVPLATPLFRINKMFMILPDITLTSTVRLHNAAENIDYTDIQIDHNQTLNAIYTVPADKTAYMLSLRGDYVPDAVRNPLSVHFHMQVRRNANLEPWRATYSFGVTPGNSIFHEDFMLPNQFPEKSDIRITCRPEATDAHVHAGFDLILVDN